MTRNDWNILHVPRICFIAPLCWQRIYAEFRTYATNSWAISFKESAANLEEEFETFENTILTDTLAKRWREDRNSENFNLNFTFQITLEKQVSIQNSDWWQKIISKFARNKIVDLLPPVKKVNKYYRDVRILTWTWNESRLKLELSKMMKNEITFFLSKTKIGVWSPQSYYNNIQGAINLKILFILEATPSCRDIRSLHT